MQSWRRRADARALRLRKSGARFSLSPKSACTQASVLARKWRTLIIAGYYSQQERVYARAKKKTRSTRARREQPRARVPTLDASDVRIVEHFDGDSGDFRHFLRRKKAVERHAFQLASIETIRSKCVEEKVCARCAASLFCTERTFFGWLPRSSAAANFKFEAAQTTWQLSYAYVHEKTKLQCRRASARASFFGS